LTSKLNKIAKKLQKSKKFSTFDFLILNVRHPKSKYPFCGSHFAFHSVSWFWHKFLLKINCYDSLYSAGDSKKSFKNAWDLCHWMLHRKQAKGQKLENPLIVLCQSLSLISSIVFLFSTQKAQSVCMVRPIEIFYPILWLQTNGIHNVIWATCTYTFKAWPHLFRTLIPHVDPVCLNFTHRVFSKCAFYCTFLCLWNVCMWYPML